VYSSVVLLESPLLATDFNRLRSSRILRYPKELSQPSINTIFIVPFQLNAAQTITAMNVLRKNFGLFLEVSPIILHIIGAVEIKLFLIPSFLSKFHVELRSFYASLFTHGTSVGFPHFFEYL
jgi:hypothetical protein